MVVNKCMMVIELVDNCRMMFLMGCVEVVILFKKVVDIVERKWYDRYLVVGLLKF